MVNQARRRVPPRGNPEPQAQQQQQGLVQQAVTIPWSQIILTTAATTATGYLVLEMIKAIHRSVQRRRQAKEAAELEKAAPKPNVSPPGFRSDGSFHLPRPDNMSLPGAPYQRPAPVQPANPQPQPQAQYAAQGQYAQPQSPPHLTDVSTPTGQLRHELHQMQRNVDGRLARMEQLLANHYGADEEVA